MPSYHNPQTSKNNLKPMWRSQDTSAAGLYGAKSPPLEVATNYICKLTQMARDGTEDIIHYFTLMSLK